LSGIMTGPCLPQRDAVSRVYLRSSAQSVTRPAVQGPNLCTAARHFLHLHASTYGACLSCMCTAALEQPDPVAAAVQHNHMACRSTACVPLRIPTWKTATRNILGIIVSSKMHKCCIHTSHALRTPLASLRTQPTALPCQNLYTINWQRGPCEGPNDMQQSRVWHGTQLHQNVDPSATLTDCADGSSIMWLSLRLSSTRALP
jgi:hypothetical protein